MKHSARVEARGRRWSRGACAAVAFAALHCGVEEVEPGVKDSLGAGGAAVTDGAFEESAGGLATSGNGGAPSASGGRMPDGGTTDASASGRGATSGGSRSAGGSPAAGGSPLDGGTHSDAGTAGGASSGGGTSSGGTSSGGTSSGGTSSGGTSSGGTSSGGTSSGGTSSGGAPATGCNAWREFALSTGWSGSGGNSVGLVEVDPKDSRIMYAADANGTTGDRLWRSTNGGQTWAEFWDGWGAQSVALHPTSSETVVVAAGAGYSAYKTINAGVVWRELAITGYGDVASAHIHQTNPQRLVVGTCRVATNTPGVFVSTDGGSSWAQPVTTLCVERFAASPSEPDVLYAMALDDWGTFGTPNEASAGVFRSTNAGQSFSNVLSGNGRVNGLVVHPANAATLYAATATRGVLRSTNGGTDWVQVNQGLTHLVVRDVAISGTPPFALYAGTYEGGVFRSLNGGDSWASFNEGLVNTYVNRIEVDPNDANKLYASTDGNGIYSRNLAAGACP